MKHLKTFFDGSRKSKDQSGFLTLTAVTASMDAWSELDDAWNTHLQKFGVKVFHMTDAMAKPGQGEFAHLCPENVNCHILGQLIGLIMRTNPHGAFAVSCQLELEAYRNFAEIPSVKLPRVDELCALLTFEKVLERIQEQVPVEPVKMEFIFDEGEEFLKHVKRDHFDNRLTRRNLSDWRGITPTITTGRSKDYPGLQVADMIGWAIRKKLERTNFKSPFRNALLDQLLRAVSTTIGTIGLKELVAKYLDQDLVNGMESTSAPLQIRKRREV